MLNCVWVHECSFNRSFLCRRARVPPERRRGMAGRVDRPGGNPAVKPSATHAPTPGTTTHTRARVRARTHSATHTTAHSIPRTSPNVRFVSRLDSSSHRRVRKNKRCARRHNGSLCEWYSNLHSGECANALDNCCCDQPQHRYQRDHRRRRISQNTSI